MLKGLDLRDCQCSLNGTTVTMDFYLRLPPDEACPPLTMKERYSGRSNPA
jgi:hypothetical protein